MSLLTLRFETSLADYLKTMLPALAIHQGHRNGEQTELPRMIITAVSGGGDLIRNAGVDQLEVEIQILAASGEAGERLSGGDPIEQLAGIADSVRGALHEGMLSDVEQALDPSIAFSGMEYEGHKEGRDDARKLHGVVLSYRAYCGLVD